MYILLSQIQWMDYYKLRILCKKIGVVKYSMNGLSLLYLLVDNFTCEKYAGCLKESIFNLVYGLKVAILAYLS